MSKISRKDRLRVLDMVTEIASEAARNPNVVWMIEFQEELIARLYHRMIELLEGEGDDDEDEDEDDEGEE